MAAVAVAMAATAAPGDDLDAGTCVASLRVARGKLLDMPRGCLLRPRLNLRRTKDFMISFGNLVFSGRIDAKPKDRAVNTLIGQNPTTLWP